MNGRWWSQPFAEEGSATADGILRQLGRPGLDELAVLVREAAQNSWDARADEHVHFNVKLERLGERSDAWAAALGSGIPTKSVGGFGDALRSDSYIIRISDRGTVGLRGPVRASVPPDPGEGNDFVQFLRNVGEPRDSEFGGGTYGFGKGILYRISRANTILVDTRTSAGGGLERRLMAAALGQRFDHEGKRFTGRHWWGRLAEDGIPDPLTGNAADHQGDLLGLPGFASEETGTDVYILGVDFGAVAGVDGSEPVERTPEEAARFIASAISWNLWPKMIGEPAPMSFSVELDGLPVAIPDPRKDAQLRPFTEALTELRAGGGQPYKKAGFGVAGHLAIRNVIVLPGSSPSTEPSARAFDGPSHHVARMRDAELVVDYLEGPVPFDAAVEYGAVFRATRLADEEFAAAEPPTHDAWVEQGLAPAVLAVVRNARHWTRQRLRSMYDPPRVAGAAIGGLGALSNRLASLAPRLSAGGAGPTERRGTPEGGGGGGGGRPVSARVGEPRIEDRGSMRVIITDVSIAGVRRQRRLTCSPAVVVDGGRESSAPAGLSEPRVLGWETDEGRSLSYGDILDTDDSTPDELRVVVELLPDAVTRIDVKESGLHA